MLGRLSGALRGGLIGAAIVGAFAAGIIPAAYHLGRSHERGAQVTADYQAVVASVEDQAARLAGVASTAESRLAADRDWRAEQAAEFLEDMRNLTADAAELRRYFDANDDGSCPGSADDVGMYNAAFGLAPADDGTGDPGD
jgi:hypothetical protein